MAAELVGGAFLSALVQTLFERVATREMVDFIRGIKQDNGPNLLDKLKITLRSVDALVNHAEERQTTDFHIREWLNDLKDAMFEVEDLLDKISVSSSRQKMEAVFLSSTFSKVSVSSHASSLGDFIERMETSLEKMDNLVKQKDVLGLREGANQTPHRNLQTTSLAGKCSVYGRDADKGNVIQLLVSASDYGIGSDKICVLPIVGMGGVGKTTLAQFVYNDEKVKQHFDIKAWVCVNQEFDVFKLTKAILEAIPLTCDTMDLNLQQIKLKEFLHNKRFLIVLDDVWNESYTMWEILRRPFEFGAQGSCVLVTTRNENVASAMLTVPSYHLKPLADDDCWLLFSEHAFEGGRFKRSTALEDIGREIVKKCRGLPLAAKALGGLLRSKVDSREWVKVLESKIWDFPSDRSNILPALMLSYYYLPSTLKRCFAYCSIFPKNYQFRRKELVRLWMAEDLLLHPKRNGNAEELGTEYFNNLASRSFFLNSSRRRFIMHDLIVDLAEFVSGDFSLRLEGKMNTLPSKRTRYLSYNSKLQLDDLEKIMATCENLRTFLPSQALSCPRCLNNEAVSSLISKHKSLRILSLSHCGNLTALPDFLGDLIHLRYLDLSATPISKLPESTCSLHKLEILLLTNCSHLAELPLQIGSLINLRCLDIRGTIIGEMPPHMGTLTNLQTLTRFVQGSGQGSGIEELKNFPFLKGKISISNLQNVTYPHDAMKANLLGNMELNELMLIWGTNADESKNVRSLLHWLEPPMTLEKLTIRNYGSTSFPAWLGDCQFSKLVSLSLNDCANCLCLPTLGQLPSLKALSLVGFMIVTHVDGVFYNNSSMDAKKSQTHNTTPFRCLESLHFENMPQWQEWLPFGEEGKEDEDGAFPCLKRLAIKNCPKLKGLNLIQKLPSIEKIVITKCEQLVVVVPPTICELQLECCEKVSIQSLLPQLLNLKISSYNAAESLFEAIDNRSSCIEKLSISSCPLIQHLPSNGIANTLKSLTIINCENIEFPMSQCFPYLEFLCIKWSCDSLRSFIMDLFPNMIHLEIQGCQNLESLVVTGVQLQYLQSLNSLRICNCPNFESFPEGGLRAPNMTNLHLEKCKKLKSFPQQMNKMLLSLMTLNIKECPELESIPEGGFPDSLNLLEIFHCAKLFTNRKNWDLQRLRFLRSFAIAGACEDGESFPERWLLPSTLTSFHILALWNLKYLDEDSLQKLTSLETLGIACCPKLQCMPAKLPCSISTLHIVRSPRLEERCRGRKSEDWPKIAHIPMIRINRKLLQ
ncbi:putative disease resistance RPP13-like protein 1 [Lotus japonicus]|uniref:putative disease resistance RPP13-like protein 1 n=1 Tax=Lotus japonicus TaxID=34305 RepID=UPI00258B727F|nr:putative disease resistance RPP13-like protein 1 [Lotus japonicus]